MTADDLRRLGADRRMIFSNVANGVPMDQLRAAFRRSQAEIEREVAFVGRKIAEARFRTQMPPLACGDQREIRWNRLALLDTLRQLSDDYLGTALLIPRVGVQMIDTPEVLREAAQHVHARTRG